MNLQRRIASLRAPDGRGCLSSPRRDNDILALLEALEAAGKVIEAARRVTMAVLDMDSSAETMAIVRPIAAQELVGALIEWDKCRISGK
jgi:hypothetical protein